MKVAVCMITYNHESYIDKAVKSVMSQVANFDIELVIGEDCSSDQTRKICEKFAEQYPQKIKLLDSENNLGMQQNFLRTLKACSDATYIALLDGDDYWLDNEKLKKQVTFMEAHPETAISFHKVQIIDESKPEVREFSNDSQKEVSTIYDLCNGNFIFTSSCLFRNTLKGVYPEWLAKTSLGDYPVHMLNAASGNICFMDEAMSIYRKHDAGSFSSHQSWSKDKRRQKAERMTQIYDYLLHHFLSDAEIVKRLNKRKVTEINALRIIAIEKQNIPQTKQYSKRILTAFFKGNVSNPRLIMSCFISYLLPTFHHKKTQH